MFYYKSIGSTIAILSVVSLVLLPLLSAADPLFGALVSNRISSIGTLLGSFPHVVLHIVGWIVGLILLFSCVISVYVHTINNTPLVSSNASSPPPVLSTLTVTIVLTGIVGIYVSFLYVQSIHIFASDPSIIFGALGVDSYAFYVHDGFRYLILVCIISFGIVRLFWYHKSIYTIAYTYNKILAVVVGCAVIALALVAFVRLGRYVNAYGLTFLRIFAGAVIGVVALHWVGIVVWTISRKKGLTLYMFSVLMIVFLVFSYINVDSIIAAYNISAYDQRYEPLSIQDASVDLDTILLSRLSQDAIVWQYYVASRSEFFANDTLQKEFWEKVCTGHTSAVSSVWYQSWYEWRAEELCMKNL